MEDILVNSILMTKRRRIPNSDACKSDLKEELCTLFKVYKEACSLYEKEIVETPPDARLRSKADEYKIGTMCTKIFSIQLEDRKTRAFYVTYQWLYYFI